MDAFWRLAQRVRTDWRLLAPLLAANVAGMVFGWYYYVQVGQFVPSDLTCQGASWYCTPWWSWPLVSDSPNAVALFFVAAVASRAFGRRSKVLDASAFLLNVYVGLWTTFVFLAYPERMGTWEWGSTNNILFFTHLGMPLQALTLVPAMRDDRWTTRAMAGMGVFMVTYVMVDYWGPMWHPAPFLHPADEWLHIVAPWLMVLACATWWLLALRPARAQA